MRCLTLRCGFFTPGCRDTEAGPRCPMPGGRAVTHVAAMANASMRRALRRRSNSGGALHARRSNVIRPLVSISTSLSWV